MRLGHGGFCQRHSGHADRGRTHGGRQNPMNEPESQADETRGSTVQVTMRLLRRFLPGELRGLTAGLLLLLAAAGVALLQPWPLKLVLDSVVGTIPLPETLQRLAGPR